MIDEVPDLLRAIWHLWRTNVLAVTQFTPKSQQLTAKQIVCYPPCKKSILYVIHRAIQEGLESEKRGPPRGVRIREGLEIWNTIGRNCILGLTVDIILQIGAEYNTSKQNIRIRILLNRNRIQYFYLRSRIILPNDRFDEKKSYITSARQRQTKQKYLWIIEQK